MSRDYGIQEKTRRDRLLALLWDLQWHSYLELNKIGGIRYSARLLELRRLGWSIEDYDIEPKGKMYRLTSTSMGVPQKKQVKVFLLEEDAQIIVSGMLNKRIMSEVARALGSFRFNKHKL